MARIPICLNRWRAASVLAAIPSLPAGAQWCMSFVGTRASMATWWKPVKPTCWPKSARLRAGTRHKGGLPGLQWRTGGWFGFGMHRVHRAVPEGQPQARRIGHARHPADVAMSWRAFDNLKRRLYLIVHAGPARAGCRPGRRPTGAWTHSISAAPRWCAVSGNAASGGLDEAILSAVHPRRLHRCAVKAQDYIRAGDAFQVVLSQRMSSRFRRGWWM